MVCEEGGTNHGRKNKKEKGLESVMNDYCKKKKLKVIKVKLDGMDHLGILNKKFKLTEFSKKIYSFIITRIKLLNTGD